MPIIVALRPAVRLSQIVRRQTGSLPNTSEHSGSDFFCITNAKTTSGQPGRERIRCDPPDSRLIVQPIRKSAVKTLRPLAEPHWLMPQQLKILSRSPASFRLARSVQQGLAMLTLRRARRPVRGCGHKPSRLEFAESPRSSGHLFPARSR